MIAESTLLFSTCIASVGVFSLYQAKAATRKRKPVTYFNAPYTYCAHCSRPYQSQQALVWHTQATHPSGSQQSYPFVWLQR